MKMVIIFYSHVSVTLTIIEEPKLSYNSHNIFNSHCILSSSVHSFTKKKNRCRNSGLRRDLKYVLPRGLQFQQNPQHHHPTCLQAAQGAPVQLELWPVHNHTKNLLKYKKSKILMCKSLEILKGKKQMCSGIL